MRDVYVISAHTIKFGKYLNKSVKNLAADTVIPCLDEAGLDKKSIQALWFSNSGWGMAKGQSSIRGQVALRPLGIDEIPITNVENACAGGSTAFHHAWMGIASGLYDCTMAVGVEKMNHPNKYAVFTAFLGGLDIENIKELAMDLSQFGMTDKDREKMNEHLKKYSPVQNNTKAKKKKNSKFTEYWHMFVVFIRMGEMIGYDTMRMLQKLSSGDHSPFMDVYGFAARQHMNKYGSTPEQLAHIASKNHSHAANNPNAQYTFTVSPDQVLADRMVSWPLTRSMCAPIGDGAASAILCDESTVKRLGLSSIAVKVRASILGSGKIREQDDMDIGERLANKAYEAAGLGPEDVNVVEVHDATAYGELHQSEAMGFFPKGEGGIHAMKGATTIGGKIPINPSGGLESRGHPIGASGLAQIHELVTQLRGKAGQRQIQGARIAMAENGGGALGREEAAMCMHILEAPQ